ncbi:enoyl-CoA hydratase [Mycolicibacterium moriokaense]|uniref:enoyl-CoA hydratase/isomerase family protein n=1 Tax=Mycolicibacterium moriokaense TaxID=39691 RepID=UPI0009F51F4F|nr:enoyl-CoA hydratase/isomerase family protein [Mycolicibacterium moriokaense]MCV7039162.1 enoyl-CoA hydratase/isomerase family protein [Mycolicibacterium moriokaense]ORB18554.1 enoyl-CoA hydratase [Mycolicibacterium moriokaense]
MTARATPRERGVHTGDVAVEVLANHVAVIEIRRPPNNFFDAPLIEEITEVLDELQVKDAARAVVLAAQGKHFCAGADFAGTSGAAEVSPDEGARALYAAAARIFRAELPVVAALQGAAIGGGLGLALAADFRVASPESRFSANFSRLGFHHGFGLTVTLPRAVGAQHAADLLLTGRRIGGEEAYRLGLVDRLVETSEIRSAAVEFARELATAAPLAVRSIRKTLRAGLADEVAKATEHERSEQAWLRTTEDFAEGVQASAERRDPLFTGR